MVATINLLTAANAPTAPSGHRTVVFWWKVSRKTGKLFSPKKYAHVPSVVIPGILDDKSQSSIFFRTSFEDAQDSYLKSLIEENVGLTAFNDVQLSFSAVMGDYFATRSTGGRLDGDTIEEWFSGNMMERLYNAVVEKIGASGTIEWTDALEAEAQKIVLGYGEKYKKLASGAVKFPPVVAVNMLGKIVDLGLEDGVAEKLKKRLEGMTVVVTAESEGLI